MCNHWSALRGVQNLCRGKNLAYVSSETIGRCPELHTQNSKPARVVLAAQVYVGHPQPCRGTCTTPLGGTHTYMYPPKHTLIYACIQSHMQEYTDAHTLCTCNYTKGLFVPGTEYQSNVHSIHINHVRNANKKTYIAGFSLEFAIQVARGRGHPKTNLPIEFLETFAGKNVCQLVKVKHFRNKTFADSCPHALQVPSHKNSQMKVHGRWQYHEFAKVSG